MSNLLNTRLPTSKFQITKNNNIEAIVKETVYFIASTTIWELLTK